MKRWMVRIRRLDLPGWRESVAVLLLCVCLPALPLIGRWWQSRQEAAAMRVKAEAEAEDNRQIEEAFAAAMQEVEEEEMAKQMAFASGLKANFVVPMPGREVYGAVPVIAFSNIAGSNFISPVVGSSVFVPQIGFGVRRPGLSPFGRRTFIGRR